MTPLQSLIILLLSGVGGWLFSVLSLKILFYPRHKNRIWGFPIQGVLPFLQTEYPLQIGKLAKQKIISSKNLSQLIINTEWLNELHPEIEKQVDHFLQEKLKTVFPLLYKFMGEKTLTQFKTVFMEETENLLPVMIQRYADTLSRKLPIEEWVQKVIEETNLLAWEKSFRQRGKKWIMGYRFICILAGFFWGFFLLAILVIIR